MNFLIFLEDIYRTRNKSKFIWLSFYIILVEIIAIFSKKNNLVDLFSELRSDIITVNGILLGFTISLLTVLVGAENENLKKTYTTYTRYRLSDKKRISLYHLIIINISYCIFIESIVLIMTFLSPFVADVTSIAFLFLFSCSIVFTLKVILLLLRITFDFYLIISKRSKKDYEQF